MGRLQKAQAGSRKIRKFHNISSKIIKASYLLMAAKEGSRILKRFLEGFQRFHKVPKYFKTVINIP